MHTNKLPRPLRPVRWNAGYDVNLDALRLVRAVRAVRQAEADFNDMAGDVQEGATYSTRAFDAVNARYEGAKRKLREVKQQTAH